MIVLYTGARGRGKTLSMTRDGYNYYCDGWKIIRNYPTGFGEFMDNEDIIDFININSDDPELRDIVLMVDEIQFLIDSRRSSSKNNLMFSNFIQQIRKRNIKLLCTTQYANTVDKRLKQHVDVQVSCNFVKELNICECIYQDMTAYEDAFMGVIESIPAVEIVYNAEDVFPLYETNYLMQSLHIKQ